MMPEAPRAPLPQVRAIEERAFNAWPALQTLLVDGWIMRFADGYTKRANSINAWQPAISMAALLPHAASLYAARRLPIIVRVTPLADPEADPHLASLGFARIDETIVMSKVLPPVSAQMRDDGVSIEMSLTPDWANGFADANAVSTRNRAVHDRMLALVPPPVAFARMSREGEALAWGLAVVERGSVGLFDIVTLAGARRQGAARRLVTALLAWASDRGARNAYLQVVAQNAPAIALYRQLGFAVAYRYHYRIAPP